jgi:hypothetical protein
MAGYWPVKACEDSPLQLCARAPRSPISIRRHQNFCCSVTTAVMFQRTIFIVLWPMFPQGTRFAPAIALPIVGIVLLAAPGSMLAQRGGGGGGGGGSILGGAPRNATPVICVYDCPSLREGLSTTDDLKNFRRAMAVQATAEQRAAFAKVTQYTQAASDRLQNFSKALQQGLASTVLTDRAASLAQAIEQARAGNQNFLTSLSSPQKSGLQELTKRLAKADSDLDKESKSFDQIAQAPRPGIELIANSAATLNKSLDSFQNEQLALGREMSILFPAPGQGVTFSLPPVTNSIAIAGESITIPASGAVVSHSSEQGSAQGSGDVSSVSSGTTSAISSAENSAASNPNLFGLKFVADLSDVQQNATEILRSAFTRFPLCGERAELQQATLTPIAPASLVTATFHIERWICPPGQQAPANVADGEATIEVKLTPSVAPDKGLSLSSEITRVEAEGFFRDLLQSGDLGVTLREQIAGALLSVLQKGADLKSTLPPVAQQSAILLKAQFQDDGADQMSLALDGQLQLSDQQTQQFAAQLKQRLAAQAPAAP